MNTKTKLILAAVAATFTMGSAFAADDAAATTAAPTKVVKKAHKTAVKHAPKKVAKTEAAPAAN